MIEKGNSNIYIDNIDELEYNVSRIYNFKKLAKNVYLNIYNIPGLNDSSYKDLYFNYIENNFHKFDIILFVVDINSALNTSDEIEILTKIINNCKSNNVKYGIYNKLLVIANKCDNMSIDEHNNLILEEEPNEMFEQIKTQVKQKVQEIYPKLEYNIIPMSAEDSFVYRILEKNSAYNLNIKYINKFGYNEYGRNRWNRLSLEQKKKQIKKLIPKCNIESTLTLTGFNGFKQIFEKYLSLENQKKFVINHIKYTHSKSLENVEKLFIK